MASRLFALAAGKARAGAAAPMRSALAQPLEGRCSHGAMALQLYAAAKDSAAKGSASSAAAKDSAAKGSASSAAAKDSAAKGSASDATAKGSASDAAAKDSAAKGSASDATAKGSASDAAAKGFGIIASDTAAQGSGSFASNAAARGFGTKVSRTPPTCIAAKFPGAVLLTIASDTAAQGPGSFASNAAARGFGTKVSRTPPTCIAAKFPGAVILTRPAGLAVRDKRPEPTAANTEDKRKEEFCYNSIEPYSNTEVAVRGIGPECLVRAQTSSPSSLVFLGAAGLASGRDGRHGQVSAHQFTGRRLADLVPSFSSSTGVAGRRLYSSGSMSELVPVNGEVNGEYTNVKVHYVPCCHCVQHFERMLLEAKKDHFYAMAFIDWSHRQKMLDGQKTRKTIKTTSLKLVTVVVVFVLIGGGAAVWYVIDSFQKLAPIRYYRAMKAAGSAVTTSVKDNMDAAAAMARRAKTEASKARTRAGEAMTAAKNKASAVIFWGKKEEKVEAVPTMIAVPTEVSSDLLDGYYWPHAMLIPSP